MTNKPTEETEDYFIWAENRKGKYPDSTENCGKWLIFVSPKEINELWQKVKLALKNGKFGDSAKVSTAKPNPNANSKDHVICVYTYDWTDKEDVMRIRNELRNIGVDWKIPYKSDKYTLQGKYKVKGDTKISKYYE